MDTQTIHIHVASIYLSDMQNAIDRNKALNQNIV